MTFSRLKSAENCDFQGGVTDGPTDGPTDGQTDPLIEMRGRIKKDKEEEKKFFLLCLQ